MNFRCPYCRHPFGESPQPRCPACGKVMSIPKQYRRDDEAKASKPPGLSPDLRRKQRELAKGVADGVGKWSRVTSSPRYIAVLVILFVLLGAVLARQVSRKQEAAIHVVNPVQKAAEDLGTLRTALEMFHSDCGRYPSTRESLLALLRNPRASGWDGPYLKNLVPDPWKHPYRYSMTKGTMRLSSDGPDGKTDTPDDITAPPPAP